MFVDLNQWLARDNAPNEHDRQDEGNDQYAGEHGEHRSCKEENT